MKLVLILLIISISFSNGLLRKHNHHKKLDLFDSEIEHDGFFKDGEFDNDFEDSQDDDVDNSFNMMRNFEKQNFQNMKKIEKMNQKNLQRIQQNSMNGVAEMKNPDNFNMDIPGFGSAFSGLGGMFGGFGADLANLGGNGSNSFSQSFSSVSYGDNTGKDGHSHIHSKSVVSSFSDDGKGKPKEIVIGKEYENDSDKNNKKSKELVSTYEDDGDDKPKRVILGKEVEKDNDKEVQKKIINKGDDGKGHALSAEEEATQLKKFKNVYDALSN